MDLYDREIGEPSRKSARLLPDSKRKSGFSDPKEERGQQAMSSSGKIPIIGFVRAKSLTSDVFRRWFPPPAVPADFVPVHKFLRSMINRLCLFYIKYFVVLAHFVFHFFSS